MAQSSNLEVAVDMFVMRGSAALSLNFSLGASLVLAKLVVVCGNVHAAGKSKLVQRTAVIATHG